MTRRAAILGTAALAAVAIAGGAILRPASAAPAEAGWWTRNPAASAPDGGLQVANAPDGVVSFGAVRSAGGGTITEAMLTLVPEGSGINANAATLRACPAAGTWSAGKGTLADAPKADCAAGSVDLVASNGTWTADVASLLSGERPAVAVVPAEGATVFEVSFAPPELVVKTAATSSPDGSGSGPPTTMTVPPSSPATVDSAPNEPSFTAADATYTPAPITPVAVEAEPASLPAAGDATVQGEAAAVAGETAAPATPVSGVTSAATGTSSRPGNPWTTFLLFAGIAAAAGSGAGLARNRLAARGVTFWSQ